MGSNNLSKTFSGFIQESGPGGGPGGGSLTKIGTGALTLTAVGGNEYSGGTTVNAGSLFVDNPNSFGLSGTGDGAVTVNGGTLGGNGVLGGAVTVNSGATLAPGPTGNGSTGILNTGDLTLASGSIFSVDLAGAVAGTSYDQVFASGAVSISNASLALHILAALSVGEQLFIVESTGALTGTFAGLNNGTTFTQDGVTFTIDYNPSGGSLGGSVELTVKSVGVGAPDTGSTFGLLALALAALFGASRFRALRLA